MSTSLDVDCRTPDPAAADRTEANRTDANLTGAARLDANQIDADRPAFEGPRAVSERDLWEETLQRRLRGECELEPVSELASQKLQGPGDDSALDDGRLARLAELFGLSAFEVDVVAALWTGAYCAPMRAEFASRDVSGHVTPLAVALALGHAPRIRLSSESPLLLWRIVVEHPFVDGGAALALDPHIVAWLEGEHDLDRTLVGHVRLLQPAFELSSWPLDAWTAELRAALGTGDRLRVRLVNDDPIVFETVAASLATRLGLMAIRVQTSATSDGAELSHERAVRIQRQAYLDRCAPCFEVRDAAIASPPAILAFPVQFVLGPEPLRSRAGMRDLRVVIASADVAERRAFWLHALPAAASWPDSELDDLALRCEASASEILQAAASAPRNAQEAMRCVREAAPEEVDGLTQSLACTFTWDDLVVPPAVREHLEEIAFEARDRARLWSQPEAARLYPQGRALVALLSGPPGTGKTMSAQVIARELGLELRSVDISRILSKWVGETAQHLQHVLSSRASRRSVLLFDEADALFGRRIEETRQAQDHFINMDLGHLMVALESYDGVVLLATNLRANLDAAFVRRIRHCVEFKMPDADARLAIWTRAALALFGPLCAESQEALRRLARIQASGAQIKNAALSAAFAARRRQRAPDVELLFGALARELAKDGASISARELTATLETSP
jgi:hypothetical protein